MLTRSEKMYNWLKNEGIPCTLILDAAVGYYMERVDLVLVGAVALTHNGGILNKVNSHPKPHKNLIFNANFVVF